MMRENEKRWDRLYQTREMPQFRLRERTPGFSNKIGFALAPRDDPRMDLLVYRHPGRRTSLWVSGPRSQLIDFRKDRNRLRDRDYYCSLLDRLLQYAGGAISGVPANVYIKEDGSVYYITEDGL